MPVSSDARRSQRLRQHAFICASLVNWSVTGLANCPIRTLWGAVLAHAAADAFLVLGMLATLAKLN